MRIKELEEDKRIYGEHLDDNDLGFISYWSFTKSRIDVGIRKITKDFFQIALYEDLGDDYNCNDDEKSLIPIGAVYSKNEVLDLAIESNISRNWYE